MKGNAAKKIILYIFASTGAVLFLLAVYTMFNGGKSIDNPVILQLIGANTVVTTGLFLLQKIESRYAILEILLDLGYMNAVIVMSGFIFSWYDYVPIWIPIAIVVIIYTLFYLLDIIRVRKDINEINELLKKNKEK